MKCQIIFNRPRSSWNAFGKISNIIEEQLDGFTEQNRWHYLQGLVEIDHDFWLGKMSRGLLTVPKIHQDMFTH